MIYLGIDPGVSGAVAALHATEGGRPSRIVVADMPSFKVKKRSFIEPKLAADLVRELAEGQTAVQVWIEDVNAVPTFGRIVTEPHPDGSTTTRAAGGLTTSSIANFSLGRSRGIFEGIAGTLGFPLRPVHSRTWKRVMGVDTTRGTDQKKAARLRAIGLFPFLSDQLRREKDHGRAEAVLIAAAGLRLDPDRPMFLR